MGKEVEPSSETVSIQYHNDPRLSDRDGKMVSTRGRFQPGRLSQKINVVFRVLRPWDKKSTWRSTNDCQLNGEWNFVTTSSSVTKLHTVQSWCKNGPLSVIPCVVLACSGLIILSSNWGTANKRLPLTNFKVVLIFTGVWFRLLNECTIPNLQVIPRPYTAECQVVKLYKQNSNWTLLQYERDLPRSISNSWDQFVRIIKVIKNYYWKDRRRVVCRPQNTKT